MRQIFFEATFHKMAQGQADHSWRDESTAEYFVFRSAFGLVCLRKRTAYPQTFAHVKGSKLYFGYGDVVGGYKILQQKLKDIEEERFYNVEFLCAIADCKAQTVVFQRDATSTLPIFLSGDANQLVVSNKYEHTLEQLKHIPLHIQQRALADLLMIEIVGGRTLIEEIAILLDRQRLVWKAGQECQYEHPPHSSIVEVEQSPDASGKQFWNTLEGTLERHWERYSSGAIVGAELSGGLDTSLINGYLAQHGRKLFVTTLLFPRAYAETQRAKLADFAQRFGVVSHQLPLEAKTDATFAPMIQSGKWQSFYHAQDLYYEAINRQADLMATQGITTVFRGVGGNELSDSMWDIGKLPYESELENFMRTKPPKPPYLTPAFTECYKNLLRDVPQDIAYLMPHQVAIAAPGANNSYIDLNIWPVMPLADPELYLYCQRLPRRYRANRNIIRAYLQARKFPESIYRPVVNEHYGDFFYHDVYPLLKQPFEAFMDNSVLAKAGFLDVEKAKAYWRSIDKNSPTPEAETALFQLYCLLAAEINLQTSGALFNPKV